MKAADIWNANFYDESHSFVSKYGNDLIELLAPKKGESILDLGCGTGDLAKKLVDVGVNLLGVDYSTNMILEAKSKYPSIPFMVADATNLEFDHEFDGVFSNAALHWVKPPQQALHCIYKSLKQGGRFVAEFGGRGNVQMITDAIIEQIKQSGIDYNMEQFPWYYPSIGEYTSLMEKVGFRVTFAEHFDRPTPLEGKNGLKNWIKMFGSQLFLGVPQDRKDDIIEQVENQLREVLFKDGKWIADYKRIRVIGIKS
jgi:ubiquinone/menaquinone biosynthesis C-methylase UbiE